MPKTRSVQLKQASFDLEFVSRGHGKGHAVPDMAIAGELIRLAPNLRIGFVSYAAGAAAYRARGFPVTDMQAPELPPFLEMVVAYARMWLLRESMPRLIVSHEEIPALPAAAILGIPCVYVTDFFMDPTSMFMRALAYASEVVFTAEQGLFTEPPYLKGKVHYVGRAVRPFEYTLADRERARRELAIPPGAAVALLQPGSWVESRVPFIDLMMAAWELIPSAPKRLIWITGSEDEDLRVRFGHRPDLILLKEDWRIDRLMAASDVLITKANRMTVYEAAALGLPSVSVSALANWPDDVAVANVKSNISLSADSTTPEVLTAAILEGIASRPAPAVSVSNGVARAAARIARRVNQLLCSAPVAKTADAL